jgi:hypothetical protein
MTCDTTWERILLSAPEKHVLRTFRDYLIAPGEMLCFSGHNLERDKVTLELLSDKDLLDREEFEGGYSLTKAGFTALCDCD